MNEMASQLSITIDVNKSIANKDEQIDLKEKNEFEKNLISAYKALQFHNNKDNQNQLISPVAYLTSALNSIKMLNQRLILNNNILDKLTRISSYGIYSQILIGKIYLQLLEQDNLISSLQGPLLITFLNQVINLLETIKTTSIEYLLEQKINSFISTILNNSSQLEAEQRDSLKLFISKRKTKSKDSNNKQTSLIDCTSFEKMLNSVRTILEKIPSLEAQYDLFIDNIDEIITVIQSTTNEKENKLEDYVELGDIFMVLLFSENVVVLYQSANDNETNVVQFCNQIEQEIPFIHNQTFTLTSNKTILFLKEQMIPLVLAYINQFSLTTISSEIFEIQYICFMLLRRLYLLFPNYNNKFSKLLIQVAFNLCRFENNEVEECRQLIRNIIDYAGTEEHFLNLKLSFTDKHNQVVNDQKYKLQCNQEYIQGEPFGVDGVLILDYDLKIGFFNTTEVHSGEMETIYIEIDHPYSLVDFTMLINDLDINVSFLYLKQYDTNSDAFSNNNCNDFIKIKQFDQVDIYESPKKFLFFISSPGIMKVTLDNSYSWFNSKTINFKANVFYIASKFDLVRTISIINFNVLLSNQIDQTSSLKNHSNKVVMFKLGRDNKAFNAGKLHSKISKYNHLLSTKEINETFPLFIKGNIIWKTGDAKNRKELTKEAFDTMITDNTNNEDNDSHKFTIIHLFNMSNEDKSTTFDIKELLPFSLSDNDFGEKTIVVKSNFIECCLMFQIYYYVLGNKYVHDYLLYIHYGEFGLQLCGYLNGVIDYITEFDFINDLTTTNQQCQLIADFFNKYAYPPKEGKSNEREVIEIFVSGIQNQCDELANGIKKAQWNNNIDLIINKKDDIYIKTVINVSHFFLMPD